MSATLRRDLLARRETALCQLGALEGDGNGHGNEADVAAAGEARERAAARRERLQALVHELDTALERLDAGDYGVCVDCDHPIEPARLKALPEVATCRGCQERRERAAAAPRPSWRDGADDC